MQITLSISFPLEKASILSLGVIFSLIIKKSPLHSIKI
jgi:hypothetical protein